MISNVLKSAAGHVRIKGRLISLRKSKNVHFLTLSDGSANIQCVFPPMQNVALHSIVEVEGSFVNDEIQGSKIDVLSSTGENYPFFKKYHNEDFTRSHLNLRPRLPVYQEILKSQSKLAASISKFFTANDFVQTFPPILTSADCEGAGETFSLGNKYFNENVYLTVSTQLHLECLAHGLGKVYSLSPTFRAERSLTSRHLSEFRMLEAEIAYTNLEDLMSLVQNLLVSLGINVQEWNRISYSNAISVLQKSTEKFEFQVEWGKDLQSEHEFYLVKYFGNTPVFITHYPKSLKPFYMKVDDDDTRVVENFDLIFPDVGELVGGSIREDKYDVLMKSIDEKGMDKSSIEWYIELRKWGSTPTGGFGLGFERLARYLLQKDNLKEVVAFPRWIGHCGC